MKAIGFDLGTTTTSVSFYNQETGAIDYLRFDGNADNSFPSVITQLPDNNGDNQCLVGYEARRRMHQKGAKSFRNFKLLFGTDAAIHGMPIFEIAKDYIGTVIRKYVNLYNETPDRIVFTVPDAWTERQDANPALSMLRDVFVALGYQPDTQILFKSEPVAAAAYYSYNVCKDEYNGHLLVVDCGGGTINMTLCRLDSGRHVVILHRCGLIGEDQIGCAGEAFDLCMTQKLIQNNVLDIPPESRVFSRLKQSFERSKIVNSANTDAFLQAYYLAKSPAELEEAGQKAAFDVLLPTEDDDCSVTVNELVEAFQETTSQGLYSLLSEILEYCAQHNIGTSCDDQFRVVLTGGFSNLYCIEAAVRQAFHSAPGAADSRFDDGIRRGNRSTAVAHGAAILANEKLSAEYLCEHNLEFCLWDTRGQEQVLPMLTKGSYISTYRECVYAPLRLMSYPGQENESLLIQLDEARIEVTLQPICPDLGEKLNNWYKLGVSLEPNQVPHLHSVDQDGKHRMMSLAYLLSNES